MPLREDDPHAVGAYRLSDRLGSGGMGTVFLGHAPSGRDVAIKVIHEQYAGDPVFRTRFRQEVAAARRVSGAFTAAVVDADSEARRPWMATQYVPGPTLADRLRDQGPVQGGELRRLALGLAEALGDIHRAGVVHRDLKPANVLMAADGPRVIDFGISRAAENQALTATGHVMGTPPFMSPEQLSDPRSTGTASDVFSLAALLVYAVRGKGPFDADSPYLTAYRVVNEMPELDGVPQPLREVVAGCLAKEPGERPALDVVAHELRRLPERTAQTVVWPAAGDQQTLTMRSTPARGPGSDAHRPASDTPWPEAASLPPVGTLGPVESAESEASERSEGSATAAKPRRRARILLAAGALVVVAAVGAAVAVFGPDSGGGRTGGKGSTTAPAAPRTALPAGWKPWQTSLVGAAERGGRPPERWRHFADVQECVVEGAAAFCGGGSILTVRIDLATGAVLWRAPAPAGLGESESGMHDSSPLGAGGGKVIVLEAQPGERAQITALDAATGKRVWSRPASTGVSSAAVVDGLVATLDPDDTSITARDLSSGRTVWTTPVMPEQMCMPVELGGAIYARCDAETEDGKTYRLALKRLDPADGNAHELPVVADAEGAVSVLDDGRLVIPVAGGEQPDPEGGFDWVTRYTSLTLMDPTGKRKRATVRLAKPVEGTGVDILGSAMYVRRTDGTVTAVDVHSGRQLWSTPTSLERPGTPLVLDGVLYLASSSGRVLALDARTGEELWQTPPRNAPVDAASWGGPEVLRAEGALVVSSSGGTVFSFDPAKPPK
ncbi:PQQ-binding-like beta-propeller repeat protein [Streptomyces sp. YC504]|uniref:PQQ-binding-like beta-propeller repeat protein n=1 Tax=Streptomyces mesophilus TaxID=1775132 RepID=A0A6G4XSR3_9ACTN|nr:PQQ-binding-like beta-propeller repeat protein [Streptomyces mesophilus]NGO80626.1 PQQ-binding-like beta-propeller repeat protein [Streptomyces mesophilus]